MYKQPGGDSRVSAPPNARDTSSLPPEHSTWHRESYNKDPRIDRGVERDRVGAGKRTWSGDRSSTVGSFQGASGGGSMSGNGYVPRSKPRFQGHYSGFFAESTRSVPSFSGTGPTDNGLARRFSRPFHLGTPPAVKSTGFPGGTGLDYRPNDTDDRHSRDHLLPSGDGREGRDQPLPPLTPQVLSDSASLLRSGERAKSLNSSRVNWDLPQRPDRDNSTRSHGNDFYSRRRSIVTQFDSGKDWGSVDKKSEGSRLERYGGGSRDATLGDSEGYSKDSGFLHGWRRERGNSGAVARNTGFASGNRSLGEHGVRAPLLAVSAGLSLQESSLASSLLSSLEADQPSPSKRPRLGWGQGLAKYEKKIGDDDISPVSEKCDSKKDVGDGKSLVEECEKKGEEFEYAPLVGDLSHKSVENKSPAVEVNEKCRGEHNTGSGVEDDEQNKVSGVEDDEVNKVSGVEDVENRREEDKTLGVEDSGDKRDDERGLVLVHKYEDRGIDNEALTSSVNTLKDDVGECCISSPLIEAEEKKGREVHSTAALPSFKNEEVENAPTLRAEIVEDSVLSTVDGRWSPQQSSGGVDVHLYPRLDIVDDRLASSALCTLPLEEAANTPIKILPSSSHECGALEEKLSGTSPAEKDPEDAEDPACNSTIQVGSLVEKELTRAVTLVSPGPTLSQVHEEDVLQPKSATTSPESRPVSEDFPKTELSMVEMCNSEHLGGITMEVLSDATLTGWTEEALLKSVERVELEMVMVKEEIAKLEIETSGGAGTDHLGLAATDAFHEVVQSKVPLSNVHEQEEGPVAMDEDSQTLLFVAGASKEVCFASSQSSPTVPSAILDEPLLITGERALHSAPVLRPTIPTFERDSPKSSNASPVLEKDELVVVPEELQLKPVSSSEDPELRDNTGVLSLGSASLTLDSKKGDYAEGQFGDEKAKEDMLVRDDTQSIMKSLILENQGKARSSVVPFTHLLPEICIGESFKELYSSPTQAPVWRHNERTHNIIQERLFEKLAEKQHSQKFRERVLTLRYRALKEAWTREQESLCERRNRSKAAARWDVDGRSNYGPPSQRTSLRLRPMASSVGRLDPGSEAAHAMKKLMKESPSGPLRTLEKMPAMILEEERMVRKFVSKNALVEDPVAMELERRSINPWTLEEKKIFIEKFAIYNKNFKEIANHLACKTTADCVEYYYRNQKSDDFEKTQRRLQLKNRRDYTRTNSSFLAPTTPGNKRHREANPPKIESLNVAMKLSQNSSHLKVTELPKPTASSSDPFSMPTCVELFKGSSIVENKVGNLLEVAVPSGTGEAAASSLISTPCSVSSTAAPLAEHCKERSFGKIKSGSVPSTTKSSQVEPQAAGLKGTRSMHLRRMSSRSAAQEVDSQWSDGERSLFTNAVTMFGKDFRLIASHVGSKSQGQCKAFFSKTRKRLGLDELVEQFEANEAAAMLIQSFRHNGEFAHESKRTSARDVKDVGADCLAGGGVDAVEELLETATAVSTLESLKERSIILATDMSDLSLVADAAAVMEENALMNPESHLVELPLSCQQSTTADQANSLEQKQEPQKVESSSFIDAIAVMSKENETEKEKEEEDDSEATRSDDGYQVAPEAENDIVVDQAAAALVGMSGMFKDKEDLKRSKSDVKPDPRSSPVSVFARSHSAHIPNISPPLFRAVSQANLTISSGKNERQSKEKINVTIQSKPSTRDRTADVHDSYVGRKGKDVAGGEAKPRREPTSWTQEEKEKFAAILQEHGKDWAMLHDNLPSKSLTQIKTYFQNSKARSRLPTSDKLVNVVRTGTANRKRKAEEFETSRKGAELAIPLKQKTRASVVPPEVDTSPPKEDTSVGATTVTGTSAMGVDILAYAARFGAYPGQPVDQDLLSMSGIQNLVRQVASANAYVQQNVPQGGQQIYRPGARPAVASPAIPRPQNAGAVLQQVPGSSPSKVSESDSHELQALSSGAVQQANPPPIHHVAQQVQQMIAQQQHLQKQLAMLLQQQNPQLLLQQQQQNPQLALQAVQPLEQKLQQVVQQLQQQHEQQGRAQAQAQAQAHDGEVQNHLHFQHHQSPQARGILKVRPIRGAIAKPQPELAISPTSGVFQQQISTQHPDKQQEHSPSFGVGRIQTSTAGSTAGLVGHHSKEVDLQDSDTDTDCEGTGSRPVATDDTHQRMSVVHSTSSGQQQGAAHSTTSTLSSDSEQVKTWDVKLFGQSLLSKPPSAFSTGPRPLQEPVYPSPTAPIATLGFPVGTLAKGFRSSESLPSAFGRVGALPGPADAHPSGWPGRVSPSVNLGNYSIWRSTGSSSQVSGVTEPVGKGPDSESVQEIVSPAVDQPVQQHVDIKNSPAAPSQMLEDDKAACGTESQLTAGQLVTPVCSAAVEESSSDVNQTDCASVGGVTTSLDAGLFPASSEPILPASQKNSLHILLTGHEQWG